MYRPADVIYLYDGSFAGFLCCVFESVARREQPFGVWPQGSAPETLFPARQIDTQPDRAARVYRSLAPKLGQDAKLLVSYGFLHGSPDKELVLLRFLQFAYATGPSACRMLGHPAVAPVIDLKKQVGSEAHQLVQFLRFQEVGGMLGSVIGPKNYVLPLLRPHFCGRFPEEDFLIVDRTHSAALLYQGHQAQYLELAGDFALPPPTPDEARYRQMWKAFYKTISIQARENPALRRSHCPKRYWHYMLELQDQL